MICPKCKGKIKDKSGYCPKCELYFPFENEVSDTDLLNYYIPKSSNKIPIGNISIWYLLFGGIYAVYKKMYYVAINTFLVDIFATSFTYGIFSLLIDEKAIIYRIVQPSLRLLSVAIHVYYIVNFKKELVESKNIRINEIKSANSNIDNDELVKIIKKDSKNNVWGMIISAVAIFVISCLRLIMMR